MRSYRFAGALRLNFGREPAHIGGDPQRSERSRLETVTDKLSFLTTRSKRQELEAIARADDRTMSWVLRRAVDLVIAERGGQSPAKRSMPSLASNVFTKS